MKADHLRFLDIMNRWFREPRFQRLTRYNQARHWLDYQSLREGNYRDFLAWILNPREGHGLGDFFIRRLLQGVASSDTYQERLHELADTGKRPTQVELEQMSFASMHVIAELQVAPTKDSKSRIDLFLVDPQNELLIVIERKDGAKISQNQLDNYEKWARKKYPDYKQLRLVLDSCDNTHEHISDQ